MTETTSARTEHPPLDVMTLERNARAMQGAAFAAMLRRLFAGLRSGRTATEPKARPAT